MEIIMTKLHSRLVAMSLVIACCSIAMADSHITYLEAHKPSVRSIAVSPNGKFVASGDDNGVIVLWKLPEMSKIATIDLKTRLPVRSITFSEDSKYVFSPGTFSPVGLGPVALTRNMITCPVLRISVADLSIRELQTEALSNISFVSTFDRDRKLVTIDAANELLISDLSNYKDKQKSRLTVLKRKQLPGLFFQQTLLSDDKRFLAITTYGDDKVGQPPSPELFYVVDLKGNSIFSHKFESTLTFGVSRICFQANPTALWLCAGTEGLQRWDFDAVKEKWNYNQVSRTWMLSAAASCVYPLTNTLYQASDKEVLRWDVTKKSFSRVALLDIGEGGEYVSKPINTLVCIPNPSRLLAGLQDGKIAVIPLDTEKKQVSPTKTKTEKGKGKNRVDEKAKPDGSVRKQPVVPAKLHNS